MEHPISSPFKGKMRPEASDKIQALSPALLNLVEDELR
jgi:hypothetical protein